MFSVQIAQGKLNPGYEASEEEEEKLKKLKISSIQPLKLLLIVNFYVEYEICITVVSSSQFKTQLFYD